MKRFTRAPNGADGSTVLRVHSIQTDDECILWTGYSVRGYGRVRFRLPDGRMVYRAHRLAWETYIGAIPDGMELDHRCGVTLCINIRHLQLITTEEHRALERERRERRKRIAAFQQTWTVAA